ncbi:MAG: uroporphyrinogen-III C-methyltransferase [Thermoproteota archaeon]|jgi:uroporphyrin-III C-methyltransferase|uniref:uroporphyrinogen-III C-methyltransferase n=1 Tax=Candidatus Methanodesulfokora washburnensis TaxID=2478471 RepID=A0A429GGT4_9CREN|nr:uroporphyrinogen-III C-methyltransferase [Candidatus Methanodesulfokores washburnensis]RSN73110.1 uroporphyrinogen-III C-methyltransferase [Candidatus Methanodesulfokores washburnensis]RZN60880.1 MAG: uroporphyrinogen-III C-methyltransferase [Candidatus Methanodesulfokores washburnensis]TDA41350.1 MAG: uroporphyrinogen-III C-methyltransferase [Candidatus Korarchaeota archaeon]
MGKVYIVGAGPGDPELITLKGLNILRKADVVIYDRLVSEDLVAMAVNAKELIYMGKHVGESERQKEINKLLIEKARQYEVVVRLKNGDPFVFGRGGEECEALRDAGIEYEVIPGISSALAAPLYAGIPLTHRNFSSSVTITVGHRKEGKELDLKRAFRSADTVVVLMGVSNLAEIVKQAMEAGLSTKTPVAIIERATTREQRVITGTLEDIVKRAEEEKVSPPAVIVFGNVVRMREKLRWI